MPSDAATPTADIINAATARARDAGAPMAGLLTPTGTWELFNRGEIELVDTRTAAERDLIGYVPGSVPIEWYDYPAKKRNEHFLDDLRKKVEPDRPVAFLCRSGVRSHHAAALATANGYRAAFNILRRVRGRQERARSTPRQWLAGGGTSLAAGLIRDQIIGRASRRQ
jgi:rhodanese-related sulfurtransferase